MIAPGNLSVVIPTHNRKERVTGTLQALALEAGAGVEFEVIVVADACEDGTEAALDLLASRLPFPLRICSHAARNAAATRNLGASGARGATLVFLDDDMEPQPGLVRAHSDARGPRSVVMGYSKPVYAGRPTPWQQDARRWWEDSFREMASFGHRFTYRDFFSGNCSLPASLFHSLGGMDASLGRLEDYEFGWRLLGAGASFHFEPAALALHHDASDLDLWLARARHEGEADFRTGTRHPEVRYLLSHLAMPGSATRMTRLARKLAFALPARGDGVVKSLASLAGGLRRRGARGIYFRVVALLREYNYARGVALASGGRRSLLAWLQEGPLEPSMAGDAPVLDADAPPGPECFAGLLEAASRTGLRVRYAGVEIGVLPPRVGAEPLRSEHVRRWLHEFLTSNFVPEWAMENGEAGLPLDVQEVQAC